MILKHISRCQMLLHCVDPVDPEKSILERIEEINHELGEYGHDCLDKPQVIVLTKSDCMTEQQAEAQIQAIRAQLEDGQVMQGRLIEVISVSSQTGHGLQGLKEVMATHLDRH